MEDNKKEITSVEVFKKLEEVEKQNKEILEKLENMQESNALFHNGFATIFEVLRDLNEVKQNEESVDMLESGSRAHILSAVYLNSKRMKTTSQSKGEKAKDVKDVIEFIKMLKNI